MHKDFKQLRRFFDGSSLFMSGHRICKIRKYARAPTPEWLNNNKLVEKFIRKHFPLVDSDEKQRQRAGLWAAVICRYFRAGESDSTVEF